VSFIVQDREKAELIADRLQAVQLFGSSFQLTVEQYVEGVNAEQIGGGILPDLPELIDAAYRDVKFNARTGKFEFVPEGVILAEEAERGVKALIEELNVRADIIMLQGMVRVAESEGRIERDSLLAINDALELVDIYQEDGSDQISLGEKVVRAAIKGTFTAGAELIGGGIGAYAGGLVGVPLGGPIGAVIGDVGGGGVFSHGYLLLSLIRSTGRVFSRRGAYNVILF